VVLMSETTAWDHPRQWWRELIKRRWIAANVQAAFVGGAPHREYAAELGIDGLRIWDRYNVVDNAYFASQSDACRSVPPMRSGEAGLPRDYFLYVGRFSPEKNLLGLLAAYKLYRLKQGEGWNLVLVGDGPQRAQLHRFVESERIPGILWPGFKQIQDLPPYYASAGCFILPSSREPWGLVVNEAMASSLPVLVSSRCGCAMDLVQPGRNGFTFDPANPNRLAELMATVAALSEKEHAAMGHASRDIISQWTPEIWASQLELATRAAVKHLARPR
jgi:glycosyltransferase involved in cell wall biosynthesis